jgi:hypothetical protein
MTNNTSKYIIWGDLRIYGRTPIKMDFRELGCGHVDWNYVSEDRGLWQALTSAVI